MTDHVTGPHSCVTVPEINIPLYRYGKELETVGHLLGRCEENLEVERFLEASEPIGRLLTKISTRKKVLHILRWLYRKLPEYRGATQTRQKNH